MPKFVDKAYESDSLQLVIQVRMSEDEAAAYGAPAGAVESELHAFNGGSKRRFGIRARGFVLKRTEEGAIASDPPGTLTKDYYSYLPVGTVATWGAAAIGSTVSVGGTDWEIIHKDAESVR